MFSLLASTTLGAEGAALHEAFASFAVLNQHSLPILAALAVRLGRDDGVGGEVRYPCQIHHLILFLVFGAGS